MIPTFQAQAEVITYITGRALLQLCPCKDRRALYRLAGLQYPTGDYNYVLVRTERHVYRLAGHQYPTGDYNYVQVRTEQHVYRLAGQQ